MGEVLATDTQGWQVMENNIIKPIKYEILRCEICGDSDQTHLFASPLTRRVICMKCAKEAK